jgi:F0F1-type ATP synthase assembly protein I
MDTPGHGASPGGFMKKVSAEFGPFLTLGLQLAISVVAFFFFGRWLDEKCGTGPWLMISGAVLGIVGGLISFIRKVTALAKRQDEEAARARRERDEIR